MPESVEYSSTASLPIEYLVFVVNSIDGATLRTNSVPLITFSIVRACPRPVPEAI